MKKYLLPVLLLFCLYESGKGSIIMRPYLMSVSANSIYVIVETNTPDTVTVQYSSVPGIDSTKRTTFISITSGGSFIHKVILKWLTPSTHYFYRAFQGASVSDIADFRTTVNPGISFKFVWMADYRTGVTVHDQVSYRALTHMPDFVLNGGDVCEFQTYSSWKNEYFRTNELNLISRTPFYYTPGNHEGWNDTTKAFIINPVSSSGTQDYYSFDYGDYHFLSINNYTAYNPGSQQYNFIQNDLSSTTKPWKIVFCHKPPYCAGGHGNDSMMIVMAQNIFIPNNVDVVFSGHSHFFQHNKVGNIHYMVIGSSGAPLYDPDTASYVLKSVKDYCYGYAETTPNSFFIRVYNNLGTLLDSLRITKQVTGTTLTETLNREFILYQNFPNPFNPSTLINFELVKNTRVRIEVFDLTGRVSAVLLDEYMRAGRYSTGFDGINLPSGIYFYRLKTPEYSETRKMVLLK